MKTVIKKGKFKFVRPINRGIRRNEKIRKLATSGKLGILHLKDLLQENVRLGIL